MAKCIMLARTVFKHKKDYIISCCHVHAWFTGHVDLECKEWSVASGVSISICSLVITLLRRLYRTIVTTLFPQNELEFFVCGNVFAPTRPCEHGNRTALKHTCCHDCFVFLHERRRRDLLSLGDIRGTAWNSKSTKDQSLEYTSILAKLRYGESMQQCY